MDIKNKKYFCYEIYKNLSVWSSNGKLGYNPCSFFSGHIKTSDTFNIREIWNSPEHHKLKHCVENDIPISGCADCYKAEAQGLESRRLGSKKLYEQFHNDTKIDQTGPSGLDYSVGNLCNLKCVICGPHNSTKWIPDYQTLYPLKSLEEFKYEKFNQTEITDPEVLKNIKTVHFHGGGEPLMSDSHFKLLKNIQKVKGLSDVRVFYNTNGTQLVSNEILNLWEECKLIELYFSIDDVGERFNYQRTGADWDQVSKNLIWYYHNMPHNHMFSVNCVWSYLNFYYLDGLVDWCKDNFSQNRYGDPTNLIFQKAIGTYALNHCSQDVYDVCKTQFNKYPELLKLLDTLTIDDQPHNRFWNAISQIDSIRNMDFKTLSPEWTRLLT
jgi:MoaA/NifB/PqqE/SkfB family radical SAM enzyme